MTLNSWKEKCTKEEVMNWFLEKDHYKIGLKNGGTIIQIMNDLGFRNNSKDPFLETLGKLHFRSMLNMARFSFFRDGFLLRSKKLNKGTPVVYYLVDNLSEERTEVHYKIKKRAEKNIENLRTDKLVLLELMPRLKDEKTRELFQKAYGSRLHLNGYSVADKTKKMLTSKQNGKH